jgi:hypothetical protein
VSSASLSRIRFIGFVAISLSLAGCAAPVPEALVDSVGDGRPLDGQTLDGGSRVVFVDRFAAESGIEGGLCIAFASDIGRRSGRCGDRFFGPLSAIATPASGDRLVVAGWTSDDTRSVTVRYRNGDVTELPVANATGADGVGIGVFGFVAKPGLSLISVTDSDGTNRGNRTVEELCDAGCR